MKITVLLAILALALSALGAQAAAAKGGPAGGGTPAPTLPVDFPSDVPLPAGTLYGSTGSSPAWSVGLTIDGNYPDVMQAVQRFYIANGYAVIDEPWMYHFQNAAYTIQAVGAARDHSTTKTNVTIAIQRR